MPQYHYQAATLNQIEAKVLSGMQKIQQYSLDMHCAIYTLYRTGLRANEVLDVTRWSTFGVSQLRCQLSKGETFRNFLIVDGLALYFQRAMSNPEQFALVTYERLEHAFRMHAGVFMTSQNTKTTSLHALRYLFIHRLKESGKTALEIKDIIKHQSLTSTQLYMLENIGFGIPSQ